MIKLWHNSFDQHIILQPIQRQPPRNRAIANSALELWKDAEHDATTAVELQDATTTATTTAASSKRLGHGAMGPWLGYTDPKKHGELMMLNIYIYILIYVNIC